MIPEHANPRSKDNSLNLGNLDDIVYWTKKWEISPRQLLIAVQATKSNSISKIRQYLVNKGFAI